jgi:hypothetical protein
MNVGSITSNKGQKGGGIYNINSATFTMNDGLITRNTASIDGGGIYNDGTNTVHLYGGTITRNKPNNISPPLP